MGMMTGLLVADACGLLNLLGMQCEIELLRALSCRLLQPVQSSNEIQYLWTVPDEEGRRSKQQVSCAPLREGGLLETVGLSTPEELNAFIEAASRIDDADAACIALSGVRQVPLLTDDKKARRIARELFPGIGLVSTLELLHDASTALGWPSHRLKEVAHSLRWRSNFAPPREDHLAGWYSGLLR